MADAVMRMPKPLVSRQPAEEIQINGKLPAVQRKCSECEEEEKRLQRRFQMGSDTPFFQRKETGGRKVNQQTAASLQSTKGSGRALPENTRSWMESRFGANFNRVKVHTNNKAVQFNRDLNVRAFTYGSDIYFNRGEFSPGTSKGKRLLAHELTHVLQQGGHGNGIQKQRRVQDPNVYETEYEGNRYRVRRIRVPRRSRKSRHESPEVGVDVDSDNVTIRISWCQETRGEVRIGANLTGQALSLAQEIAGIITRGWKWR